MKHVLNTLPPQCVTLSFNTTVDKFYGIKQRVNDKSKGFIRRETYNAGNFILISAESDLTKGAMWSHWKSSSLSALITDIVADKLGFDVYEFDTVKELFQWLAE